MLIVWEKEAERLEAKQNNVVMLAQNTFRAITYLFDLFFFFKKIQTRIRGLIDIKFKSLFQIKARVENL